MNFRSDRMLSLMIVELLYNRKVMNIYNRIPILMYHSISDKIGKRHPYFETTTSPKVFEQQIRYLKNNSYHSINLNEIPLLLSRRPNTLKKQVAITFDDGFRDFYTEAVPILSRYDFNATVFLPTKFIASNRKKFKNIECLSWQEIRDLNKIGYFFGSHTVSHQKLYGMQKQVIEYELRTSKLTIEQEIGKTIESFSYPYAFPEQDKRFSGILKDLLIGCEFDIGLTTRIGTASHNDTPFFLKRIPVNTFDDEKLFRAKLHGAYNWIYYPQKILKHLKGKILYRHLSY